MCGIYIYYKYYNMEEDSLICVQPTKLRPAWSIGLQQYHTMQSLPIEDKVVLEGQLGSPSSLKTLAVATIRKFITKLAIEQGVSCAQLSQRLPLPSSLKRLLQR